LKIEYLWFAFSPSGRLYEPEAADLFYAAATIKTAKFRLIDTKPGFPGIIKVPKNSYYKSYNLESRTLNLECGGAARRVKPQKP